MTDINEKMTILDVLNDLQVYDSTGDPGYLREVLDRDLERLVKTAKKTNKATELTCKLKFTPAGLNTLHIQGTVDSKEPRPVALPLTAYTDTKGAAYLEDPNQTKLPFEKVSKIAKSE